MKRTRPEFSLLIPVYNLEDYLKECIESIVTQTYVDFEAVFVDDGSTDSSARILDDAACKDARIRVIHHEHAGLGAARNTLLKAARGEYIIMMDGDDAACRNLLERVKEVLEKAQADIVCYNVFTQEKDAVIAKKPEMVFFQTSGKHACWQLTNQSFGKLSLWSKVFTRSILKDCSFWEGKLYEDIDFLYRVMYPAKKVVTIPDRLYIWKERPGSITYGKAINPGRLACSMAYTNMLNFMAAHHLPIDPVFSVLQESYAFMRPSIQITTPEEEQFVQEVDGIVQTACKTYGDWNWKQKLLYSYPAVLIPVQKKYRLYLYRIKKLFLLCSVALSSRIKIITDSGVSSHPSHFFEKTLCEQKIRLGGKQLPGLLKKKHIVIEHIWDPENIDSCICLFSYMAELGTLAADFRLSGYKTNTAWDEFTARGYEKDFLEHLGRCKNWRLIKTDKNSARFLKAEADADPEASFIQEGMLEKQYGSY